MAFRSLPYGLFQDIVEKDSLNITKFSLLNRIQIEYRSSMQEYSMPAKNLLCRTNVGVTEVQSGSLFTGPTG
jgi:hypothetical protein